MSETQPGPTPSPAALAAHLRTSVGALVRAARPFDELAPSPAAVLDLLDRQGPMTTADLAASRGVRHQTIAATVKELTAAGHLAPAPDPSDARKKVLTLTTTGRAAIEADRVRRTAALTQAVTAALDDPDRRALADALTLIDRLTTTLRTQHPHRPSAQPLTGDW